jgi:hypothetical protein
LDLRAINEASYLEYRNPVYCHQDEKKNEIRLKRKIMSQLLLAQRCDWCETGQLFSASTVESQTLPCVIQVHLQSKEIIHINIFRLLMP